MISLTVLMFRFSFSGSSKVHCVLQRIVRACCLFVLHYLEEKEQIGDEAKEGLGDTDFTVLNVV